MSRKNISEVEIIKFLEKLGLHAASNMDGKVSILYIPSQKTLDIITKFCNKNNLQICWKRETEISNFDEYLLYNTTPEYIEVKRDWWIERE